VLDVINFGLLDRESENNYNNYDYDSEELDDITIHDPKQIVSGNLTINQLRSYLVNTNCVRKQQYLDLIIEKVRKHLNFE
jgi:hypothetical protein